MSLEEFICNLDMWHVHWDVLLIQEGLLGGVAGDFSNGQSHFLLHGHAVMYSPGKGGVHGVCILVNSRLTCHVTDPIVHNEFLITTYLHLEGKHFLRQLLSSDTLGMEWICFCSSWMISSLH